MKLYMNKPGQMDHIVRPENVLAEVKHIVRQMMPHFNFGPFMQIYQDIIKLFTGEYPGYRSCNTGYHDLRHTEDCLLVVARLVHGAHLNGFPFTEHGIALGLISAIMHDTGYIQSETDQSGTGAKYTLTHIERSIDFMEDYFQANGISREDFRFCRNCLKCTGLNVNLKDIQFVSAENEILGKILGTADLIGQMADPNYLEKLPVLYEEFREGAVPGFDTELDLLKKTPDFWDFTQKRFRQEFSNVDRYLKDHFRVRYGIARDLERDAIEHNINQLNYILEHHADEYRRYLQNGAARAGQHDWSCMPTRKDCQPHCQDGCQVIDRLHHGWGPSMVMRLG